MVVVGDSVRLLSAQGQPGTWGMRRRDPGQGRVSAGKGFGTRHVKRGPVHGYEIIVGVSVTILFKHMNVDSSVDVCKECDSPVITVNCLSHDFCNSPLCPLNFRLLLTSH